MAIFVVQEHHAKKLHWDFRLEVGRVLKSWAVPKGPSLDPAEKRLAIQVPDHEYEHGDYEGIIPEGTYGAGAVLPWDHGSFEAVDPDDAGTGLQAGKLSFRLLGNRLKGEFALVKMRGPGREKAWLLIKKQDAHAQPGWRIPILLTEAVAKRLLVKVPKCAFKEQP